MDTLVTFLIRSALVSGLMLGYYHLALRNRRWHSFNRVWLLTALLASLVLPLIRLDWLTWHPATRQPLSEFIASPNAHATATQTLPVLTIAMLAGAVVSVLLLIILGLRIRRVYRLKRGHLMQPLEGCVLIEVQDRRAPFSFLKNLFWQEGADILDPVNQKIIDHELAHIRGGHTYDILLAQTLAAVCWMNPFYWLIRRELQMVHEFIADDASIASGDTETFARMLLRAYDEGRYLDPSHHFFHSPIKRRLRMINSSKPPSGLWKALALPAFVAVVALACSKEQGSPLASVIPDNPANIPANIKLTKFKTLMRDSVKIQVTGRQGIKTIYFLQAAGKDSVRRNLEPTGQNRKPGDVITVQGMVISDKEGNDPPPLPNR